MGTGRSSHAIRLGGIWIMLGGMLPVISILLIFFSAALDVDAFVYDKPLRRVPSNAKRTYYSRTNSLSHNVISSGRYQPHSPTSPKRRDYSIRLLTKENDDGDIDESHPPTTTSSSNIAATSFNLIKVLLGSGVLALPSGVAAFSDHRSALKPAIGLISVLGILSAYTFGLYGRLVHSTNAQTLSELWEIEKGQQSSWIIAVASLTFCFGAALAYTILLGDVFSSLAKSAGFVNLVGQVGITRQFWILVVSSTILFPLCNLKSLLALAPLSLAGVLSVLITTGFMGWRCPWMNPTSPYALPSGDFLTPTLSPVFDTFNNGIMSPASMVLVGMAATAYLGHFSAPGFYHSLQKSTTTDDDDQNSGNNKTKDEGPNSNTTLHDYFKVTKYSFSICAITNCLVMTFGFLTFGGNCQGIILNNYSTADIGASICRLLMAICVTGGFPFLIAACRSEILSLLSKRQRNDTEEKSTPATTISEKKITTILLTTLTSIALVVKNAGFVIGLTGAVAGSSIGYTFPAQLYLSHTAKKWIDGKQEQRPRVVRLERYLCHILVVFGVISAGIGGAVSFIDNFWPHLMK